MLNRTRKSKIPTLDNNFGSCLVVNWFNLTVFTFCVESQDNKRRTKPVFKNLNPEWNYQVVYPHVHKEELKYKTLEVTVWDYDRFKSNDFLGKVEIDLSSTYGRLCYQTGACIN